MYKYLALASFIVGVLTMVQIRTQDTATREDTSSYGTEVMVETLIDIEGAISDNQAEIDNLTRQVGEYQNKASRQGALQTELEFARQKAGVVGVVGPGMVITLNDSQNQQEAGVDPNNYYIHESFLREIVNAFWTGGAEAVAINEQRVGALTEIFCGGTTIFVNKTEIAPPYKIKAIGKPDNLRTSLNMDVLPFLSSLEAEYGIHLQVDEQQQVQVPPMASLPAFKYAHYVE